MTHLCETRWNKRHDGVLQFTTGLPDILSCLQKISNWKDRKTAGKASLLITALCESQLIIGLFCLSDVLSLTLPLSRILQKETIDLARSAELIHNLLELLEKRREENKQYFNVVYIQAESMAKNMDIEIKVPRICSRQTKRANYPVTSDEDYYRVSVYIPMLDNIIQDLRSRFTSDVLDVLMLPVLMPEVVVNTNDKNLMDAIDQIVGRFNVIIGKNKDLLSMKLRSEVTHWKKKWEENIKNEVKLPTKALNVLQSFERDIYPIIYTLLKILCIMPVTNASSERSFSTLRLIKTWLRTTMSENRLVGLALLHIHPDIIVDPHKIIERFAKSGNHRMIF